MGIGCIYLDCHALRSVRMVAAGCSVFVLSGWVSPAAGAATPPGETTTATRSNGATAPTAVFEPNVGQAPPEVAFIARAGGFTLLLGAAGATLAPCAPARPSAPEGWQRGSARRGTTQEQAPAAPLRVSWLGAVVGTEPRGESELPGRVNYFRGADPSQWRTGVPTFARVRYAGIYPGIDLVYRSSPAGLEYDFELAPGADPSRIRIDFDGATSVEVEPSGNLRVHTATGSFVERAPVVYQEDGGERRAIAGRFTVSATGVVGFDLGAYDPARPVVIDPVIEFSTYLGGSGTEVGYSIDVDSAGCVYVAGSTSSLNFPVERPIDVRADDWRNDVFVSKLAPDGGSLVYSTYLSGSTVDDASSVFVDGKGCVYITGNTGSADFPTHDAVHGFSGVRDAFVTKLGADGSALEFSTFLGGSQMEYGNAVVVQEDGLVWIAGTTDSPDFPTARGTIASRGGADGFVAALMPAGNQIVSSRLLGGSGFDAAYALATDGKGGVAVSGRTESANFPVVAPLQLRLNGDGDAFVARLEPDAVVFATYFGGSEREAANGIAVDETGNVVFGGETTSPNLPVVNGQRESAPRRADSDGFVARVSPTGRTLLYSSYVGGTLSDAIYSLALGPAGDVLATGYTDSRNFPVVDAVQRDPGDQRSDAFVFVLSSETNQLSFSTYLGGELDDLGWGVAAGVNGRVYVTGQTMSTTFPTTAGAFQRERQGVQTEAFVTRLSLSA